MPAQRIALNSNWEAPSVWVRCCTRKPNGTILPLVKVTAAALPAWRLRLSLHPLEQFRPARDGPIGTAGSQPDAWAVLSVHQAGIPLQSGPPDRAVMEFHSDAIALVRQLVTISHLPAGRITVQRSDPYDVAQLPELFRKYTSAVWTDVIGVRPLPVSIGTCRLTVREAHHDDNGQPPFRPATELVVQRNLAQTETE